MMLTLALLAGSLPLMQIDANDNRVDLQRAFISSQAKAALANETDADVLCLDRGTKARHQAICLVRAEWTKAVTMAEAQPNLRNAAGAYNQSHGNYNSGSRYGIGNGNSLSPRY